VFEDNTLNEKTVAAVEKQIHYGDSTEAEGGKGDLGPQAQEHEVRHVV
jgi:hypothetical protein